MQALYPLAVFPVRFAPRWNLDLSSIDQEEAYATRFEDLVDRQPVDSGRFHRHGIDATGEEPVSQQMEIGGEGSEGANGLCVPVGGHTGIDLIGADIQAGSIGMDTRQAIARQLRSRDTSRAHRHGNLLRTSHHQLVVDQPNHNDVLSFLIGVRSARSALPPVGESQVIGNQVPARDRCLQCVVGSELLVNRDRYDTRLAMAGMAYGFLW